MINAFQQDSSPTGGSGSESSNSSSVKTGDEKHDKVVQRVRAIREILAEITAALSGGGKQSTNLLIA